MKTIEKFIEVESLIENLMKKGKNGGGILRLKTLFFCSLYENLSVSMIIEKLGIKKSNFALITAELQRDGCIIVSQSIMDKRCHQIELTQKGREELDCYLSEVEESLGATNLEIDKALEQLSKFLNKVV